MPKNVSTRGPLPKRTAESAGHRGKDDRADVVHARGRTEMPPPDHSWSDETRAWYTSLATSGQARYYEPSDWQYARVVAFILDDLLNSGRPSAEMFKALSAGMDALGTTEGARRRMRIEVERDGQDSAGNPAAGDAARSAVSERFSKLRAVE